MEKVRDALKLVPPQPGVLGEINDAIIAAALAEVEEWEEELNRRRMEQDGLSDENAAMFDRAEAAEAERDRWRTEAKLASACFDSESERADRAEAEAARLRNQIDCADTPLMRDVLAERDRLKAALDWHGSGRPSPEQVIGWYEELRADEKRYGPQ